MSSTYLQRYVQENVCKLKLPLVPLAPAFMFINVFRPEVAISSFSILLFVWVILWLAVPCNVNLNCNRFGKKDGTKALFVSFLIIYGVLLVVAVSARLWLCETNEKENVGGILENVSSLFQMRDERKVIPRHENGGISNFNMKADLPHFHSNLDIHKLPKLTH